MVDIIFLICAITAIGLSLLVVIVKNPIYSSLYLVGSFVPIAAIYIMMYASFIAVIQILVYAGAIMVLFTFVIMMIDVDVKDHRIGKGKIYKAFSILLVLVFLGLTLPYLMKKVLPDSNLKPKHTEITEYFDKNRKDFGSTKAIGELIFSSPLSEKEKAGLNVKDIKNKENEKTKESMFIISFELSSILIMVAIVGAVVLGKRRRN